MSLNKNWQSKNSVTLSFISITSCTFEKKNLLMKCVWFIAFVIVIVVREWFIICDYRRIGWVTRIVNLSLEANRLVSLSRCRTKETESVCQKSHPNSNESKLLSTTGTLFYTSPELTKNHQVVTLEDFSYPFLNILNKIYEQLQIVIYRFSYGLWRKGRAILPYVYNSSAGRQLKTRTDQTITFQLRWTIFLLDFFPWFYTI